MTDAMNPYAPPSARVDDVPADPNAEAIRRQHITHEASIKAVGFLYYLGGIGVIAAAVASLFSTGSLPVGGAMAAALLLLGGAQLVAGWGVRALRPWGRIVGAILSALGLLSFPFGTLINGYILYLYFSKKGRTIFSPEYKDVIAATPHVKYRTSIIVWIFVAVLVAVLVLAGVAIVFTR